MPITNVAAGTAIKASKINEIISYAGPSFGAGTGIVFEAGTSAYVFTSTPTPVKAKEVLCGASGTFRVLFTLQSETTGGQTVYGQVYKNGVAVGTEQSIAVSSTDPSATLTQDVTLASGDLLQMFIRSSNGIHNVRVASMRLGTNILPANQPFFRVSL